MALLVHLTWFIHVKPELARERIAHRHVNATIEPDLTSAYRRVDSNDMINLEYVNQHKLANVDVVILQ